MKQDNGHLQGCPWSGILSSFVLHLLLTVVGEEKKGLAAIRARNGLLLEEDDDASGEANPVYFIDDGEVLFPLAVAKW